MSGRPPAAGSPVPPRGGGGRPRRLSVSAVGNTNIHLEMFQLRGGHGLVDRQGGIETVHHRQSPRRRQHFGAQVPKIPEALREGPHPPMRQSDPQVPAGAGQRPAGPDILGHQIQGVIGERQHATCRSHAAPKPHMPPLPCWYCMPLRSSGDDDISSHLISFAPAGFSCRDKPERGTSVACGTSRLPVPLPVDHEKEAGRGRRTDTSQTVAPPEG